MVVAPVDERNAYRSASQGARGVESAESAANNHHARKICGQKPPPEVSILAALLTTFGKPFASGPVFTRPGRRRTLSFSDRRA